MLVEVKGYIGFFDDRDDFLAMKLKQLKSYREVQRQEGVEVRLCFVIHKNSQYMVYWESLNNILTFPKIIEEYVYDSKNKNLKSEKYVFWNCNNFRTDENNLSKI